MSIQNVAKVALLTGLVAVLAGCGGTPAPSGPVEVEVILQEFKVESSLTTFQVGTEYSFVITNKGTIPHEFLLEAAGAVDVPLESGGVVAEVEEEDLGVGATETFTWTFDTPGEYQIACHVPSHYEAGMVLAITVQ